jgi:hypothetical protein
MEAARREILATAQAPVSGSRELHNKYICVPYPFADFDFWYTKGLLWWKANPGQTLPDVMVPEGFCTDLTSVPRLFWSFFPKTGRYAYAAIAHDYLYWTQTTTREQADSILKTAMEDSRVGTATVYTIYSMVRAGGYFSWNANTKARGAGEKRLLKILPPENQLTSWADWKKDPANFSD